MMNTRRKLISTLGACALASPLTLLAQQPGKVWRIGYLDVGSRQSMVETGRAEALIAGLRERGHIEGRHFVLEGRYADGNAKLLDALAAELIQQRVDLIVTLGTPASHAAQVATATIPIVVATTADPVVDGFADSLARPGRNITGMSSGVEDTIDKLFELLLLAAPKLSRIAVFTSPSNTTHPKLLTRIQAAARKAGKQVSALSAGTPEDIGRGFKTVTRERIDGVIILADSFFTVQRKQFAELALRQRIPSIGPFSYYPEAGGMMSYGADINDNFRRVGLFVDKIFKGAKPGDIPFEQPTRYYLTLNRKTANALGIKLNNELLARADKVIE